MKLKLATFDQQDGTTNIPARRTAEPFSTSLPVVDQSSPLIKHVWLLPYTKKGFLLVARQFDLSHGENSCGHYPGQPHCRSVLPSGPVSRARTRDLAGLARTSRYAY